MMPLPPPAPPLPAVVPPVKLQLLPTVGGPAAAQANETTAGLVRPHVDVQKLPGWETQRTEETQQLLGVRGRSFCLCVRAGGGLSGGRRFDSRNPTESQSHEMSGLFHLLLGGGGVDGTGQIYTPL